MTCIANDYAYEDVFARQVEALAAPGDFVVAFSTSGRSANVVGGLAAARARGATTVLFTGADSGPAGEHADVSSGAVDNDRADPGDARAPAPHRQRGASIPWAAAEG